jgi:hypothetical protein
LTCTTFSGTRRFVQIAVLTVAGAGALGWSAFGVGWAALPAPARVVTFFVGYGLVAVGAFSWSVGLINARSALPRTGRLLLITGLSVVVTATAWDAVLRAIQGDVIRCVAIVAGAIAVVILQAGVMALGVRTAHEGLSVQVVH